MLRCDSGVDTLETPLVERERDDELLLEREIGVNADAEDGTENSLSEREKVWLLEREIGVDNSCCDAGTGGCDAGTGGFDAGTAEAAVIRLAS